MSSECLQLQQRYAYGRRHLIKSDLSKSLPVRPHRDLRFQGAQLQNKAGAPEPGGAGADQPSHSLFLRPRSILHGEGPVHRVDPPAGELSCSGVYLVPRAYSACGILYYEKWVCFSSILVDWLTGIRVRVRVRVRV